MLQLPLLPLRDGQIRMPKVYHKDEAILLKKSVTAKRFKKSEGRKIAEKFWEMAWKMLDVLVVLWQSPRLNHFLWNAWRMYPQTTACMHMWMELPTVVRYHRTNTPKLELTTFRFGAKKQGHHWDAKLHAVYTDTDPMSTFLFGLGNLLHVVETLLHVTFASLHQ